MVHQNKKPTAVGEGVKASADHASGPSALLSASGAGIFGCRPSGARRGAVKPGIGRLMRYLAAAGSGFELCWRKWFNLS